MPRAVVELRPSLIPGAGLGLFATRSFDAGQRITQYGGRWIGTRDRDRNFRSVEYMYEAESGHRIDGDPRHTVFRSAAAAHMANDALHVDVTGFENNTDFQEVAKRTGIRRTVWLVAKRRINAGDELLVSYTIGYWLQRRDDRMSSMPRIIRSWLRPHAAARALIERTTRTSCHLGELVKVSHHDWRTYTVALGRQSCCGACSVLNVRLSDGSVTCGLCGNALARGHGHVQ